MINSGFTSLHQCVEQRSIDEEEQVGTELKRDVRMHLKGREKLQRLL